MKYLFIVLSIALIFSCSSNNNETIEDPKVIEEQEPIEEEVIENPPVIQTPEPVIYLADNLDEQDKLGWCIDTKGIGFNEDLHAHSCKPSGGDVQFYYNEETHQIFSVEYTDYCLEMTGGPVQGMIINLVISDFNSSHQKFNYNFESGEFIPEGDNSLCLAVGATSSKAGIYMSRTLSLEPIEATDGSLKKWIIKGGL